MANNINLRKITLEMLLKVDVDNSYSNIVLDKFFESRNLSIKDRAFVSTLFFGVLEQRIFLDYVISKYSNIPLHKIQKNILNILRMGIYQILFFHTVKDYAYVNESVNLIPNKNRYLKGYVNAVLRNFIAKGKKVDYPNKNDKLSYYYSIKYSCPENIINMWIDMYGVDKAKLILKSCIGKPPIFLNINTLKISVPEFISKLEKEFNKIKISRTFIDSVIKIEMSGDIKKSHLYGEGLFYIQDLSSSYCCTVLSPKPDDIVFDMCCAPGGKSFTIAKLMNNKGVLKSFDVYQNKIDSVRKRASEFGINIIDCAVNNSSVYCENFGFADKVLCDVPCSGLGTIRRKPEIKYKDFERLHSLYALQYQILLSSSNYVKPGGDLVYSTCTLNMNENDFIVDKFLKENPHFEPIKLNHLVKFDSSKFKLNDDFKLTLFPDNDFGDGFFISKLKRVKYH